MNEIEWPADWQAEAREALTPYLGSDARIRIVVGPSTSIDGAVLEGYVYLDGNIPTCIHERSQRPDVYPWRLLQGPVLRIEELRTRRKPTVVYAHPDWAPR